MTDTNQTPEPRGAKAKKGPWRTRFQERRARIRQSTQPALVPDALAMCTLDELTDPEQVKLTRPKLAEDILTLTRYLMWRTVRRASFARVRRDFEAPVGEDEQHRATAERVEALLRTAITKAFPSVLAGKKHKKLVATVDEQFAPALAFDVRAFERVIARFVAGEIGTGRISPVQGDDPLFHDGVPDGSNWFGFAEAALLFVRLGLSPMFWRRTLPVFVAGSIAFTTNYWDRTRRTLDAYACTHYRELVSSTAVLAILQQHHGALDLPHLARAYGDLLAVALRDDDRLHLPVPTPPEFA